MHHDTVQLAKTQRGGALPLLNRQPAAAGSAAIRVRHGPAVLAEVEGVVASCPRCARGTAHVPKPAAWLRPVAPGATIPPCWKVEGAVAPHGR